MSDGLIRSCPECMGDITYKNKASFSASKYSNSKCDSCKLKSYRRNCPVCDDEIIYGKSSAFRRAIKNNSKCNSCGAKDRIKPEKTCLIRKCPKCEKEMLYDSESGFNRANTVKGLCKDCGQKRYNDLNPEVARKSRKKYFGNPINKAKRKTYKEKCESDPDFKLKKRNESHLRRSRRRGGIVNNQIKDLLNSCTYALYVM